MYILVSVCLFLFVFLSLLPSYFLGGAGGGGGVGKGVTMMYGEAEVGRALQGQTDERPLGPYLSAH